MEITQRAVGVVTVLDFKGRMTRNDDYGVAKERITALLTEGPTEFVLNHADVPYMDSTSVGELVSPCITVRNKGGGGIKLYGATGRIKELLTIAKLDTLFEVFDTEAAALDSFAGS